MLLQIKEAQSQERLDWIAEVIKCSTWDGEDYTLDEAGMNVIRMAWKLRSVELSKVQLQTRN